MYFSCYSAEWLDGTVMSVGRSSSPYAHLVILNYIYAFNIVVLDIQLYM